MVGLMSIAAASFSALQSFLNFGDKAEKHRAAGAKYNAVGRQPEQLLAQDNDWGRTVPQMSALDRALSFLIGRAQSQLVSQSLLQQNNRSNVCRSPAGYRCRSADAATRQNPRMTAYYL